MKILYFIKGLGVGGAERHLLECALASKNSGHEVKVIYVLRNKDALVQEFLRNNIDVCCLGGRLWWLCFLPNFFRFLVRYRPDLVHAHLPIPAIASRAFKVFFRYKIVTTEHNVFERMHPLVRVPYGLSHAFDDETISCSSAVARTLPWDSVVIDNGISPPTINEKDGASLRDLYCIPSGSVIFICIANFLKKKNHGLLISAFEVMLEKTRRTDCVLIIVGRGEEESYIKERIDRSNSKKFIRLFGAHPKAADLLFQADVFCLSSHFEGLPLALLESMFVGLPSVVTGVGGMSDAVQSGYTGIVVPPNDTAAYADAMAKLADSADLRYSLGKCAKLKAESQYSLSSMTEKLFEVYDRATRV